LWEEGTKKEIVKDEKSVVFLHNYITRHLKALIARSLWTNSHFFEIINEGEEEIIKALSIFNNPTEYNSILKGKK